MQDWIINVMQQYGYIGVFSLIVIENIFPPIPSEIILAFGGFMTTQTEMNVLGVLSVATLGSLVGAILLYWLGTILNFERIEKLTIKYGRFLGLKIKDVEKAMNFYKKYENKAVFLGRMVPVVRSLISIPAGMAKMNLKAFVLLTVLGSLIWNSILVVSGTLLGQSWQTILYYFDIYSSVAYIIIASSLVIIAAFYTKTRISSKHK
ncbi:MAG: alkaline phosphatase [Firmicutes bacterium HGW-Firmicutes-4]|jgi:membrane protein DedA with SNARE-associated domain|uniref:DedA family protein n=2 Tax=Acetobacterium TaxID=33951 RepID=A0A5D0WNB5_9FIRM|nr:MULTISPECIES: DedA family protein [Acetobacterium]MBC3899987.1 DedA family protein [Acetobacterium malicum]PKM59237.1 MAG: alkaline phosphatase [Firmicutes bacterium HGW-Firmicutes-4]TYC85533.1 DedA family protein [Acetobacterium wieringae]